MAKIGPNTIREIAQHIDCGENTYLNIKTGEIIGIPHFDHTLDEEYFLEVFGKDMERIKNPDCICFSPLKSKTSFEIMQRFAHSLTEGSLKSRLLEALSNKKPFRNFKNLVDNSEFRENWFEFKQQQIELLVTQQLEKIKPAHNSGYK